MKKKILHVYKNPARPMAERVADLSARMTLAEKVSQLVHENKSIPRLGIPAYNWWNECLHGVARAGTATVFPQVIGLAATFDKDLMFRIGTAISDEARAKHHAALRNGHSDWYRGLTFAAPNINIFRDPRWGRGQETYGEDPYLTGQMASAFVKGLQGNHPHYLKASAMAKHFAVHSGPEKGRHSFNSVVSLKDLHETYLPAFKTLVDAGVEAVMTAYNRLNGEPCCASPTLIQKILRKEWGFKGHVTCDYEAIDDLHLHHRVTKTPTESAALAVKNGCELAYGYTFNHLLDAIKKGLINEREIDSALASLLRTRFKLGMFDSPRLNPYASIPESVIDCKRHRALAREAGVKSIVLLKNKNSLLPLPKDIRRILIVGPNAASTDILLGNYHGLSQRLVTVLEGIAGKVSQRTSVWYKHGCLSNQKTPNPLECSIDEAKKADVVIAVMGLSPALENEEGDALASDCLGDRKDIRLPPNQEAYFKKLCRCGKPVVLVLAAGSPLAIPEIHKLADAILYIWYPGEEGGNSLADIIFGDAQPSGRLPVTFPKSVDQLPAYRDYNMQGRTYRFMKKKPLYPFGFGLGYTRFTYSDLRLIPPSVKRGNSLKAKVTLTNAGRFAAEEVVQVYLNDRSVRVPLCSLKAFRRVHLRPNQPKTLSFEITPEMMALVDKHGKTRIEPGRFRVIIGGSSPCDRSSQLGAVRPVTATFIVK